MSIQKFGRPKDDLEHKKVKIINFLIYLCLQRVLTKENTPIVPILACTSFKPKKPNQTNLIEAYLVLYYFYIE